MYRLLHWYNCYGRKFSSSLCSKDFVVLSVPKTEIGKRVLALETQRLDLIKSEMKELEAELFEKKKIV